MNHPKTNTPILSKRVSASRKNVKKPKQTNVSIIETISPLISTRTQNDSTRPKTTTTAAKILSGMIFLHFCSMNHYKIFQMQIKQLHIQLYRELLFHINQK